MNTRYYNEYYIVIAPVIFLLGMLSVASAAAQSSIPPIKHSYQVQAQSADIANTQPLVYTTMETRQS